MTPTLSLPSEIITNSRTEIECAGEVGLNTEVKTIAKLSFEVQFPVNTIIKCVSSALLSDLLVICNHSLSYAIFKVLNTVY